MRHPKRLKRGELAAMTDAQRKAHLRELQKYYRSTPRGKAKSQADNKKYAELYAQTKPFKCVCNICGKTFQTWRKCHKRCEDCRNRPSIKHCHRIQQRQKNCARKGHIFALALLGMDQIDIARHVGCSQSGVSSLLRRTKMINRWREKKNERNCDK